MFLKYFGIPRKIRLFVYGTNVLKRFDRSRRVVSFHREKNSSRVHEITSITSSIPSPEVLEEIVNFRETVDRRQSQPGCLFYIAVLNMIMTPETTGFSYHFNAIYDYASVILTPPVNHKNTN